MGISSNGVKESVSPSEINAYEKQQSSITDCTTLSKYDEYTLVYDKAIMYSINLNDQVIGAGETGVSYPIKWTGAIPLVVDNTCEEIQLSDLKAGDILGVYVDESSTKDEAQIKVNGQTRLIQKRSD